jgi:cation diffusion facilitator CzcD-associated flavoprotein CzcO
MPEEAAAYDAIVVGAGFAGLFMLRRLRGLGLRAHLFEAGDQVGGTWYWNRYPGARCDFPSHDYSYEFDEDLQQEWTWTEHYPSQPEIQRYLAHVADRFGLAADITLGTRVTAAHYDEAARQWNVQASDKAGTVTQARARFVVMATGALSAPRVPDLPGLDSFGGRWFHTAAWPEEKIDFTGRRVAVIGTGSSGVQAITAIAGQAAHLTVVQRTAGFVVPSVNAPLTAAEDRAVKAGYPAFRERARQTFLGVSPGEPGGPSALAVSEAERNAVYEKAWKSGGRVLGAYNDLLFDQAANDTAADFIRGKIAETVDDQDTARRLMPHGYPVGAKRIVLGPGYYDLFNRPNVDLVDLRDTPITAITPAGLRTTGQDGAQELPVDDIVFATGFDALTGPLLAIDIRGTGGRSLRDDWAAGPVTYLGLGIAGFPNLFSVAGPGGPGVLTNVVRTIEHDVEWITALLAYLDSHGYAAIEADPEQQRAWGVEVVEAANRTLFPKANSWYLGANIPGKPRVFMPYAGGLPGYRQICADVAADGYRGFILTKLPRSRPKHSPGTDAWFPPRLTG